MMLLGYNTNVPHNKKVYHIQTEDKGEKIALITTVVYCEGSIVARRKTDYTDLLKTENHKKKINELMKNKHKEVIKELISGKFDNRNT